jgi:hypothetical protein
VIAVYQVPGRRNCLCADEYVCVTVGSCHTITVNPEIIRCERAFDTIQMASFYYRTRRQLFETFEAAVSKLSDSLSQAIYCTYLYSVQYVIHIACR